MPAYLLANIRVHDAERYQEYLASVPSLIARHGGKYRVRGGAAVVIEGDWTPGRFVIIEFPDRAAAIAFYDDPDYAPYRTLRQSLTDSNVIIVDGCGCG